jgi:maltose alpha-D-glucosyltransferase / alpha-amylase
LSAFGHCILLKKHDFKSKPYISVRMRPLVRVRKSHFVFGRGSFALLSVTNHHVFAYLREYEDETVLVVHNLSSSEQSVALDLARFREAMPVDLVSETALPIIASSLYLFQLKPYGFFWLQLVRDGTRDANL